MLWIGLGSGADTEAGSDAGVGSDFTSTDANTSVKLAAGLATDGADETSTGEGAGVTGRGKAAGTSNKGAGGVFEDAVVKMGSDGLDVTTATC